MDEVLSNQTRKILKEMNLTFRKAGISEIDLIMQLYKERAQWFKENNIQQWTKYMEHHPKKEFEEIIKKEEYYILENKKEIICGFQITTDSSFWNDTKTPSYYINKIVTKVGYKNFGHIIFKICKDLANKNKKEYLRIECLTTNNRLNNIYEKHGFKLIRTGEDYYKYSLRECKL